MKAVHPISMFSIILFACSPSLPVSFYLSLFFAISSSYDWLPCHIFLLVHSASLFLINEFKYTHYSMSFHHLFQNSTPLQEETVMKAALQRMVNIAIHHARFCLFYPGRQKRIFLPPSPPSDTSVKLGFEIVICSCEDKLFKPLPLIDFLRILMKAFWEKILLK